MRLEALEIAGFKSFGKKVRLNFDAPIASIVGPNGSGKSNVAEAFRFVLGEQSIKSMRGKRGEDLIFNGTSALGRQNKASVKIVLENSDRTLDIDYDQITIERVVHRDGANDYFINGSSVRLKDIAELLAGANIGSTGHHIISQGEADRILNATPKDRRAMLEDALGLKTFQYKKTESEKKLVKTEENVEKVQSLRKEIQPHLRFLKKQVEKIEKSRALKEELSLFYAEYLKRETLLIAHEKEAIAQGLATPQQELVQIEKALYESQQEAQSAQQRDARTDTLMQQESELATLRDQKSAALREAGQLEGEIRSLQRLAERQVREQESATVRLHEVESLHQKIENMVNDAGDDVSRLKAVVVSIKELLKTFVQTHRGNTPAADTQMQSEIAALQQKKADADKRVTLVEEQETALMQKISTLRKDIEASKTDMLEAERKMFELQTQKSELQSTISRLKMRQDALMQREEEFKRELGEAAVLVGREATNFEAVELETSTVLAEPSEQQYERRRKLEKMKIKVEEMGGGSSDEIMKEFEDVSERDAFLVKEIEDLEKSAVSLKQIIADLEEEINRRFRNGVQKINDEFHTYFELMFGGGEAALRLVKPEVRRKKKDTDIDFDDTAETEEEQEQEEGVDIHVSLPRKKVKGLMMLSGGERALTSIALIFAMSAVNPPPFIILDETDAALDEANSKKYADMIENLAQHSQLILITHNRETMSRASVIYGVTMIQGVSELLSIKFEEGIQYAK